MSHSPWIKTYLDFLQMKWSNSGIGSIIVYRKWGFKIWRRSHRLYKKVYNISDTDGLLEMRGEWEKKIDQTQFIQFHQMNLTPKYPRQILWDIKYIWKTCSQQNCEISHFETKMWHQSGMSARPHQHSQRLSPASNWSVLFCFFLSHPLFLTCVYQDWINVALDIPYLWDTSDGLWLALVAGSVP